MARRLGLVFRVSCLPRIVSRAMAIDIGGMRGKYYGKEENFDETKLVSKDPISQFKVWFNEACNIPEILEANAMCLATCSKDGFPSARFVLLKSYGKDGFTFCTNYSSRKGQELLENPKAALVFYWEYLKRSVRIEGDVEKQPEADSKLYFQSRPKESQLSALVSNQSQPISSRDVLTEKQNELREKYAETDVPKPDNWGSFIVRPKIIEFWQGQSDRLHDRLRFRRLQSSETVDNLLLRQGEDGWVYERLAP